MSARMKNIHQTKATTTTVDFVGVISNKMTDTEGHGHTTQKIKVCKMHVNCHNNSQFSSTNSVICDFFLLKTCFLSIELNHSKSLRDV